MAAESPGFVAYVQGGESSISDDADGVTVITIQNIIPFYYVPDGEKSALISVDRLSGYSYPLNAAVTLTGSDNQSTSLVEISNLTLSDGNKVLTLNVKPLEFYEGSALKFFAADKQELSADKAGKADTTGIYLEIVSTTPKNELTEVATGSCGCDWNNVTCLESCNPLP